MTTYPGSIVITRTVSTASYTLALRDNGNAIYCTNPAGCAIFVPTGLYPFSTAIFQGGAKPPRLALAKGVASISSPPALAACNGVGAPMVVTFMNATLIAVSGNATP